jgi:sec-independent protein translocase protein TatA
MMTPGLHIPLCLGFFGGSGGETLVIFLVVLILFGAKRLPEIAQQLGKSLNEFRKAARDVIDEEIMSQAPKKDAKDSSHSPMGEEEIYKPYDYYESYEQSGQPYHHPDEYLDPGAYVVDDTPPAESSDSKVEQAPYSEDATKSNDSLETGEKPNADSEDKQESLSNSSPDDEELKKEKPSEPEPTD